MRHDSYPPVQDPNDPRTQVVIEPTVVGPGGGRSGGLGWFIAGLLLASLLVVTWRMTGSGVLAPDTAVAAIDVQDATEERSADAIRQASALPRPQPVLMDMPQARLSGATPVGNPASAPIARPAVAVAATPERPMLVPLVAGPVDPARDVPPREALADAVRAGTLRPATPADMEAWKRKAREVGGYRPGDDGMLHMLDAYVVLQDMRLPAGLHGANSAVFLVAPGVPMPQGDRSHAMVLDMASGACMGIVCRTMAP